MLNFKGIFRTLGFLLIVEGFFLLLSLFVSLIYGESDSLAFIYSALISAGSGLSIVLITRNAKKQIGKKEGFIIVSLVWVFFSLFGALPYVISGGIPSYTDAFFETMSGFTTTGSSILNDIEALPHGLLFWRSLTQWLGGMGIIVLSLAILPFLGIGGMQLFSAEVPGPTMDKINPRIKDTAKVLWRIYVLFTLLEAILLIIGGMGPFDAICHSFTTMATGGYSTKQASIAHWESPYIQYVIILFMIIAGTNFTLSYYAIIGKPGKMFRNEEFKNYMLVIFSVTVLIAVGLFFTANIGVEKSFRDALFQVVSIVTTTGYATADYLLWHPILIVLILLLFFTGGSAGSTGGGIKIVRIVLLLKNSYHELRRLIHPNAIIPIRINKQSVNQQIITNVLAFFFFYMLIFAVSTVIFMAFVPDIATSVGAVATTLGNVGPGFGSVGPAANFYHIPDLGKWFLSLLMLMGRLELFTVIVLFSPAYWKK